MTSPLPRIAIVLVLTAFMAALMVVRVGTGERQEPSTASTASTTPVALAGHTPGSAAHDRHEYRLRATAAAASER